MKEHLTVHYFPRNFSSAVLSLKVTSLYKMEKLGIKKMNPQVTKESMAELKLLTHVHDMDANFLRIVISVHCQPLFIWVVEIGAKEAS